MYCQSAGTEQDSGTYYPTAIYDTNGNYIQISYAWGTGAGSGNSSARITGIADPRGTYTFAYNSDAIPHLTSIQNPYIQTAENYTFTTQVTALSSPFDLSAHGSAAVLQ